MPLVAIVGRPNVGKSTIFNRLTESRAAITHDEPGVTRDRVYGEAVWNGIDFDVVDTGGYVASSTDRFEQAVKEQVEIAVQESDLILFVVDVKAGITDLDDDVAALLRSSSKPVVLMANKADNEKLRWDASEFYAFGLGDVFPVSAINGTGTGELLDEITRLLPEHGEAPKGPPGPRLAVIGRPNVGKSSLVNALLGIERSIVTEISGTTRDSIHSVMKYHGREITLVDTAGLRRRARVQENVEFYSALRTERAIRECDVAILLLDATEGLQAQDIKVLKEAERMRKGLLLAVNKWDLVEKETNTARDVTRTIHDRLQTLDYVPVTFISALTKQRIHKLVDRALQIVDERAKRVPTSQLNDTMLAAVERAHPPTHRNRPVRIKYVSQVAAAPPVFAFFCNYPDGIRESYRRYLENQLREAFGFEGVPVTIVFRKK
ncbi:MAG: ribosome biogenesis GTPase Der [Rhodothermales bacterium]|nr:ribosome biogenesis GTPase Der [Rhodothermales bacterium]